MVAHWLEREVGLPEYRGEFLAQQIDGAALLEGFSDRELADLGVALMGHRERLQRELRLLRSESSSQPPLPVALSSLGSGLAVKLVSFSWSVWFPTRSQFVS